MYILKAMVNNAIIMHKLQTVINSQLNKVEVVTVEHTTNYQCYHLVMEPVYIHHRMEIIVMVTINRPLIRTHRIPVNIYLAIIWLKDHKHRPQT